MERKIVSRSKEVRPEREAQRYLLPSHPTGGWSEGSHRWFDLCDRNERTERPIPAPHPTQRRGTGRLPFLESPRTFFFPRPLDPPTETRTREASLPRGASSTGGRVGGRNLLELSSRKNSFTNSTVVEID